MVAALCLVLALAGGFDAGGHVGAAWPVGGLGRFHSSAAMLGLDAGWTAGRLRLAAAYDFADLPSRSPVPHRLLLHLGRAELGFAAVAGPGWSLDLLAGGGIAHGTRRLDAGVETGTSPCAHWGLGLGQVAGRSRVTLNFVHTMLAGGGPGVEHLLALRAGVGYAP
ncbi:MAG: hypothetical protein R6X12_06915 [bacterium]